ncbi:hypothetical protein F4861DRAFT_399260 [Xylaria intraflava]|nr:hypothetical protein F4861DRAFT_399260 [Xylaria intraflava]
MSSENPSAAASASRVSVACLPCRSRHVRCDAQQPICARCSLDGRTCEYVKSRRGGLNRARLAERRQARDGAVADPPPSATPAPGTQRELGRGDQVSPEILSTLALARNAPSADSGTASHELTGSPDPASSSDTLFSSITDDRLINLFYKYFHRCHPFVLPRHKFQQFYEERLEQESIALLIAVMRLIGSRYNSSDSRTHSTPQLEAEVTERLQAVKDLPPDPFLVQCHLLYSIASYWSADRVRARREIDTAIEIALSLGMNHRQFVAEYGCGDAVLQESLRRTWWQLYCIDAYFAAIKRSPVFPLCEVDVDTELPCEEDEYESGFIPAPKTLDDFDLREFAPENQVFSSFAYLIGATRSIALSLSAGSPDSLNWLSPKVIAETDAIIDSWYLLLPKSKKEIMKEGSVVDELMFQAHMAIHANLIALHRPSSKLPFHPLEGISSCLVKPPQRLSMADSEAVHTQRCLQSIEAQLRLLVLPVPPFCRSPFTICMTAAGTHTLLAAIKALFSGRQLTVARYQLRLVVGYIKALAKVWPQGGKNLDEITAIAREVLSKKSEPRQQFVSDKANTNSQPLFGPCVDTATGLGSLDGWGNLAMTMENQGGAEPYWDFGNEFQPDVPVWFDGY